ncbi:sugar ABC transporter ATP-binding protein [Paeniglutamicibacter gangotriensis]|uniref:Sugar ABC transporter ATP-binding protein n=1 Tax=Paeniglutamicibacter gangotriensis TaxID=254787 RepID=A0A5B0EA69_9MICC|nr:sugar ABC transporter ATP-binding protein [Paeniglutamicibacter gangotriensis]KAA0975917.1 sugar ABC transporter ATP-binding protein [Paeniglutamicibacter gangotriensis]
MSNQPLLVLEKVCKSFGPIQVINEVTVEVHAGKVSVLLGENGAGKSTLIKMIAGVHPPDGGRILLEGKEVKITDTKASEALGIATIHQELNLVPSMTIAENITLGRVPRRFGIINRRKMRAVAREALDRLGLDLDVDTAVGELGLAQQQLVEIAKALSLDARVLILDEPTAALTNSEITQLFDVVRALKTKGVGMVFISHHLDEIAEIGDFVNVLRDGQFIATVPADTAENELVRLMVGRDIDEQFPRVRTDIDEQVLLSVKDLSVGMLSNISLEVRPGEVVALAGLMGAGRTELIRAIAGADAYTSGSVAVAGKPLAGHDVAAATRAGIGHVPEDRKTQGLVLDASVAENIGYATMAATSKAGLVDRKGQRTRAEAVAARLRIRMGSIDQPIRSLSGGNQQKAVFGRWFTAGSKVLLLDEPTRGVDVGAKVEIYELINEITAAGGCVLMASSELPEVLGMSDRVLVMSQGRIAGEMVTTTATQDKIMAMAVSNVNRETESGNN